MKATEKFKSIIKAHLDEKAQNDAEFAKKYAKEGRNIDDCTQFIFSKVMKLGVDAMADCEVYEIAYIYYELNDDELAASEPLQPIIIPSVNMVSNEEKIMPQNARKRAERKIPADSSQLSIF